MEVTCKVLFYKVDFPSAYSLYWQTQSHRRFASKPAWFVSAPHDFWVLIKCSFFPVKYIWLVHESLLQRHSFCCSQVIFWSGCICSKPFQCDQGQNQHRHIGRQWAACEPLQRNMNALGTCSLEKMTAYHLSNDIRVDFLCQLSNQENKARGAAVCTKFNDATLLRSAQQTGS